MGAGKSTIAGELKDKLEMDRVEMDQMIVEKQGMSISEIFDEYGEAYFRNLESNTLIELQKRKQTIVSSNSLSPSLFFNASVCFFSCSGCKIGIPVAFL